MKKMVVFMVTGLMVLSTGAMSFADSFSSPAEIYADAANVSVEEAYELRGSNQRFGELAQEKGIWDAFRERFLSRKINALEAKVKAGELTSDELEAIVDQLEECDGTGSKQLLRDMNMQFGKGSGLGNQGNGFGAKSGSALRDGSGNGQKNGNGRWND